MQGQVLVRPVSCTQHSTHSAQEWPQVSLPQAPAPDTCQVARRLSSCLELLSTSAHAADCSILIQVPPLCLLQRPHHDDGPQLRGLAAKDGCCIISRSCNP